ncbi:hypothetical protein ABMA70_15740 [Halobacteriovorax sp. XZX-3]|uniref:hypothetical protein n=1 Tax=unclassified Halobacteriovorax TaxID=2639665 RepID=UPI00371DCA83
MELQTIFNMVLQHLARQNQAAMNPETEGCAYRGGENTKCAVGYLIAESSYYEEFEGQTVGDSAVDEAVKESVGELTLSAFDMLARLQSIHDGDYELICKRCPYDSSPATAMKVRLNRMMNEVRDIADDYNLIVPRAIYDWAKQYGYER